MDAVNKAIRLDSQDFSAYALKCMLLLNEPQAGEDAKKCFEAFLALAPNNIPNKNVLTELHIEDEIHLFSHAILVYSEAAVLGETPLEIVSHQMKWNIDY